MTKNTKIIAAIAALAIAGGIYLYNQPIYNQPAYSGNGRVVDDSFPDGREDDYLRCGDGVQENQYPASSLTTYFSF